MAIASRSVGNVKTECSEKRAPPPPRAFPLLEASPETPTDLLERGFALAHFLFPQRETAIAILTGALNKLKLRSNQEHKRGYWRDKFLKHRITRISRDEEDTFQWLIYFESESHERAEEEARKASEDDMVVRYIEALMRITTGMSSFYVNIAVHRLLHCYSTLETQGFYEVVTDCYREADEYRRAKRLIMERLESRFRGLIRTIKADRGEVRYETSSNQAMWRDLVEQCLQQFTPWSTQPNCPLKRHSTISFEELTRAFVEGLAGKANQDKIEISRCHAFIDPICSDYIADALGLAQHSSKQAVPRFIMDTDKNVHPRSSRRPDSPLNTEEQQAIANALSSEETRRKRALARELRFVVDGIERARLHLEKARELQFRPPLGSQLLEVWTEDEKGPLLLATHIVSEFDLTKYAEQGFTLALNDGQSVSIGIRHELQEVASSYTVAVQDHTNEALFKRIALGIRNWSGRVPVLPAYAGMLTFLFVFVLMWIGWHRSKIGRAYEDQLRTELAGKRAATTLSQQSGTATVSTSLYRLLEDDQITRGSSETEKSVAVPFTPTLINLELPVAKTEGQYNASLSPLDGGVVFLSENGLTPVFRANEWVVSLSVPSNLLAAGRYYRVDLKGVTSHHIRTFTFRTTLPPP